MTARDGKPCNKCGNNEWNKQGYCMSCQREYALLWARENREKHNEKSRRYYRNNREKSTKKSRNWAKNNPEKNAAKGNRRRTQKTAARGSYTAGEWKALVDHYGNKCLCCGRDDVKLTADHVIPVTKGGSSNIDNIQPLCASCNSSKYNKTIDYRPDKGLGRWTQKRLF